MNNTSAGRARYERYPIEWLLPVLFLVILFTLFPVGYLFWTSLHRVVLIFPGTPFVGLQNYWAVLTADYFWKALGNSLLFVVSSVPLIIASGFVVAKLLLVPYWGRGLVRSVVILPWVLPGAIAAVVWMWIFHPSWGILNILLYEAGLISEYIPFLTDPALARVSVLVAHTWTQVPFAGVLLMAALSSIDPTLYEQARVDGARAWAQFRHITLPHIKAMIVVLAAYNSLISLTSYDLPYALTAGGPGTATTLLSYQIWKESFQMLNFGNGAALAFLVVLISVGFIVAILKAIPSDVLIEE